MSIYFKTTNGMKIGPIDGDVTIDIEGIIIEKVSGEMPFDDTPTGENTQNTEECNCCTDTDELEFRYAVLRGLSELLQEGKNKNARHRNNRKTKRLLD